MSLSDAHPPSQSPPGLLDTRRPWAWLERLRPIRIEAWERQLTHFARQGQALTLLRTHFPAAAAEYPNLSETGWPELLHRLVGLAGAANLFEPNWPVLNEAWAIWMEQGDEENGDHLALFLTYLPVTLYGFVDGSNLLEYPPMELMHALLAECEIKLVSDPVLLDSELYDHLEQWDQSEREAVWARLQAIELEPEGYPEPLRWLPELARFACHRTGNPILDHHFNPYGHGPWFRWDEVEEIRIAWQRAQPVLKAFDRLMAWYETDTQNLMYLTDFLLGGRDDSLNW